MKNAPHEQGVDHHNINGPISLHHLTESIKTTLIAGQTIRLIDFKENQRPYVIGVIAKLRDELPIRMGWQTIRESHLSETRLRARRYSIAGEFLHEGGSNA